MRISQPKADEPIRLVETKSGPRYRVVLDVAPAGAPRRQVTRTFDSIKQARTYIHETRAGLASGTYTAPSAETVEELCLRYIASRTDVRDVTRQAYRNWLAPVLRYMGSRTVQSVTARDVEAMAAWLSREGGRRGQS